MSAERRGDSWAAAADSWEVVRRGSDGHDSPLGEGEDADHDDPTHGWNQNEQRERTGEAGFGEDAPEKEDEESHNDKAKEHEGAHHTGDGSGHMVHLVGVHGLPPGELQPMYRRTACKSKDFCDIRGHLSQWQKGGGG
jgi:hypothetical protein